MSDIAPNAYIDPKAKIADDVVIGYNCCIGPNVTIGSGCKLRNNVTITGNTTIGEGNEFFQNAVLGTEPQDLKFRGGSTFLIVGSGNIFRENITVHRGTEIGGGKTIIGDGNLLMAGVHIAHDCIVGNRVIIANNALVAGHVHIEDSTVIGGGVAIHHLVRIGKNAMIGGISRVVSDIPPFMIYEGNPGSVRGVNVVGLSRNGFDAGQIEAVKDAYKKLFRGQNQWSAIEELEKSGDYDPNVKYLIEFVKKTFQGKHGRYQESVRTDTPEDIGKFYKE